MSDPTPPTGDEPTRPHDPVPSWDGPPPAAPPPTEAVPTIHWEVPAPSDTEPPAEPWGTRQGPPTGPVPPPAGTPGAPAWLQPGAGGPSRPREPWVPPGARTDGPRRPPAGDGDSRTRLAVGAVALVVVVLAVVVGVLVLGGDDDEPEAAPAPTTTSTTTTTGPRQVSGEIEIGGGIVAIVPEGALSPDAELRARLVNPDGEVGDAVRAAGPYAEVTLERGEQRAPFQLRFPYTEVADEVEGLDLGTLVFALHSDDGAWVPIPAEVDADAGTATFTVTSLSPFGLFSWDRGGMSPPLRDLLDLRRSGTVDAATPTCAGAPAGDQVALSRPDPSISWCAELGADGARIVRVANLRRHPLTLSWTGTVVPARDGASVLSGQASTLATAAVGRDAYVLAPGEAARFTVPADGEGSIDVAYDGAAHALTAVQVGVDRLAPAIARAPWLTPTDAAALTRAAEASGCLSDLGAEVAADAPTWARATAACLGAEALAEPLGAEGAAVAGPLAAALASGADVAALVEGYVGDVVGASLVTFTVTPAPPEVVPWPTTDQEADAALRAWFASGGFVPAWASCTATTCIAGDGANVLVVDREPQAEIGRVPEASPDPAAALVGLGVPDAEVAALLTPGGG